MNDAALYHFIRQNRYGVIASQAPNGTPQSALVGISCTPALDIVFDTLKSTRKYRNLKQRPRCSLVIGWTGEETLQLEGIAEEPSGAELARLQELFFADWPECRSHLQWPDIAYFVVHATWVRHSDYNQSPPRVHGRSSLTARSHSSKPR